MVQTDASAPTDFHALFAAAPAPMLVLAPDAPRFTITDVNDAYLAAVMRTRDDLVGRGVFEAMPDNPDDPHAAGVANLRASIERAISARRPDKMPVQKYDIPRPGGGFEERWWDPVNAPVLDGSGNVVAVVHHVVDATNRMRAEAELRSHAERQAFRLALEEKLRALTDPVAMMEAATALLGEHLGAAQVGFAEVENDQAHLVIARDWNDGRIPSIVGRWRMDDFGPAFIRAMKSGETIAIPDVALDARTRAPDVVAAYNGINTRAILDVPLVKHGRMVALLFVHNPEPGAWAADAQALAEETCERLWSAVERARAEALLRESEARLRLALEGAKLGTWDWDLRTMQGSWSPRTMEILGVDDGAGVTAERRAETIHPDDRERVWRELGEAIRSGDDLVSEYRAVRPDGEVRWIASRGALQRDAAGVPVRASGIVLDVTERAAAEAVLRELNATLEQRVEDALAERKLWADVFEHTSALISVVSPDRRLLAVNKPCADAFENKFGVRPKVGDPIGELLAHVPDAQAATLAAWDRALAGESFSITEEFGEPGRTGPYYELRFSPLHDRDGRLIGASQYAVDVTERLRDQARLTAIEASRREADALYRAYFENTAEALFVIKVLDDGGFVVEDLNPVHQASIGLSLAEVAGKRIDEILPPELAGPVQEHYRRAVAAPGVYQYRDAFELHGRTTYWDTVLVPVRDGEGRAVRLIGSSRDLTPQLAAEEQLRQSQKLESMGQLTGGVAHDVNNLLTPITGALDLLQRKGLGGEREQRLINGALQSAERAKLLVQRLLAFARRQPLQVMPVDVGRVVRGMADLIASTAGPQIRLVVDIEPELAFARADANQLEMALLNLAVNARDAMPDGGRLTITAKGDEIGARHGSALAPGRYVRLSVADSGVGMDEATLKRAIEPFFSTKGIGKGTGLGLSMVHGLAAQLGGALELSSRPGLGTNVDLWLPATDESREETARSDTDEAPTGAGTALLVDDEDLVRASTADMLAELGYAVVEAASAEEALRLIEGGLAFDLLVTDHLMPGLSGTELARAVRRRNAGTRVLIVSGYAEVEGVAPDLPRLVKPFRQVDLAASLADLAEERG